ncbi:MAG: hypothetical protein Q8N23_10505 [Archangium sp.]|nr:hypothetical protein [Archangium sp.]MDP3153092.1 hypothetical protein [Archangium sp.]MDP3572225.1 hypothetical protein [Archangium sp.]
MAPLFADALDVRLELATGFDTDTFGSFSREVVRQGNQLEAARNKAKKGMELLALDFGIASEGSFHPGAFGLFASNLEVVVLVDRLQGLEIVGQAEGPSHHFHERLTTRDDLEVFARKAGFPTHGLIVRPEHDYDPRVHKGLTDWPALHAAFGEARAQSRSSVVCVESDLRAHMNPTRMGTIRRATQNLIGRIQSTCALCGRPGYWAVERVVGLPCRDCRAPTGEAQAERWACVAGDHFEIRDLNAGRFADPARCPSCNP